MEDLENMLVSGSAERLGDAVAVGGKSYQSLKYFSSFEDNTIE